MFGSAVILTNWGRASGGASLPRLRALLHSTNTPSPPPPAMGIDKPGSFWAVNIHCTALR